MGVRIVASAFYFKDKGQYFGDDTFDKDKMNSFSHSSDGYCSVTIRRDTLNCDYEKNIYFFSMKHIYIISNSKKEFSNPLG